MKNEKRTSFIVSKKRFIKEFFYEGLFTGSVASQPSFAMPGVPGTV
jgi:hypothetical protein